MKILLLGSGGRESAFAWKIAQSKKCTNLFIAPGNAGTLQYGTNVSLNINDFSQVKDFVIHNNIELVLVGPEEPLVLGIVDFFEQDAELNKIAIIGPSKLGARLEGSKDFSKRFMQRNHIPTAKYATFTQDSLKEGLEYLSTHPTPIVLKADGLAAGKGVLICNSVAEAQSELNAMLVDAKFGEASKTVVIEEFLTGIELSVFVLTDGKNYIILPEAKDYKRIGTNDTGLNTGGMGSVSPVHFADELFMQKVENRIIKPTINGLQKENIPYKGFIFIGLMNTKGEPWVIEYNVRMGDPETESVIPRIENDIVDLLWATSLQELSNHKIQISNQVATTIVLVSKGYPEHYEKNKIISNIEPTQDTFIFHAGTKQEGANVLSNGGRVLAVTSLGNNLQEALSKSLKCASQITYEGKYYRDDIGKDLM